LCKIRKPLISAKKSIDNHKVQITSIFGFKIFFFGGPSAENRKRHKLCLAIAYEERAEKKFNGPGIRLKQITN
jgi:hypothetical protein